uniref:Uncharacterized protein n=1 Tax=Rhizophora mucronata TaxID=61149 RepID=A0A2P2QFQ1_RHIMU
MNHDASIRKQNFIQQKATHYPSVVHAQTSIPDSVYSMN